MTSPYGDASGYPTRPNTGDQSYDGLGPAPSPGYPEWTAENKPGHPQPNPYSSSYDRQMSVPYAAGINPEAPYGVDPHTGRPYSDKSKVVAGLLQLAPAFFLMPVGVGRFYVGSVGVGTAQLVLFMLSWPMMFVLIGFPMFAAVWLWVVIDGIVMLAGNSRDGRGRPLRS